METEKNQERYWRKNLRIIAMLLAVWFVVSFVLVYNAHHLDFIFFGWPFGFWIAAQGALVVFCGIIWYYARTMDKLDEEYRAAGEEESGPSQ